MKQRDKENEKLWRIYVGVSHVKVCVLGWGKISKCLNSVCRILRRCETLRRIVQGNEMM